MFKEGYIPLPGGVEKIMPLGINPSKGIAISPGENEELLNSLEKNRKALFCFGWDVDGFAVDSMSFFEEICIESVVEHFTSDQHKYYLEEDVVKKLFVGPGISRDEAREIYEENPNLAGKLYVEKVAAELYTCTPDEEHIKNLVSEVQAKLSSVVADAMPLVRETMWRLNEDGIYQFVNTNSRKADVIRKLEYAKLLDLLDINTIVGSDSGEPGVKLKKGEPQLRKVSEYLISKGVVKDHEDFTSRAGYGTDMVRDIREMLPSNLKHYFCLADKATKFSEFVKATIGLSDDRFTILNAKNIDNIPSIINHINYRAAVNSTPAAP